MIISKEITKQNRKYYFEYNLEQKRILLQDPSTKKVLLKCTHIDLGLPIHDADYKKMAELIVSKYEKSCPDINLEQFNDWDGDLDDEI
jgi:hypothetical protein